MLELSNVSLIAVTSGEEAECIKALNYSSQHIKFAKKILFTDKIVHNDDVQIIKTREFTSIGDWGKFIIFELHEFIDTDFVLLVHADGFVVNPSSWSNDFLEYDYIGAPWPVPKDNTSFRDHYGNIIRVGNSVSLRSKRLLSLPSSIGLKWSGFDGGFPHEDGFICVQHRHTLVEDFRMKFPPLELAMRFGRENTIEIPYKTEPFTFHKWRGANSKYPNFNRWKYFKKRLYRVIKKLRVFL